MKRNIIKILTIIVLLVSFNSCEDYLNVKPAGQIVLDDFWKSEADVEAVIATCYKELISSENMNRYVVWGELRSDNMIGSSGVGYYEDKILESNILPTNSYANWSGLYKLINYCNSVLYYAPTVIDPNFTNAELRAKMAEALTLRSLAYFYLVRTFKNVPLIISPSLSDIQDYNVAQSSEDEVLDQLETDLLQAEQWAMSIYDKEVYNKGRITKDAVRALLADVYLWRNKYESCVAACDNILSNEKLELILADDEPGPYSQIFGKKNSTESIFEAQFSINSSNKNYTVFDFYGSDSDEKGQFSAPSYMREENYVYINSPLASDVRSKDYIKDKDGSGYYRIFKYTGSSRFESLDGKTNFYSYRSSAFDYPNWIFYRLTDVMLMKAEALALLDRSEKEKEIAIHMVNIVYMRSNPTLTETDTLSLDDYNTKAELEELVMLERQRELIFEGKRWFDLVRMARRDNNTDRLVKAVIRKSEENSSIISSKLKDMNAMYMPIHEDEMKANNKLVQNEFYLTDVY